MIPVNLPANAIRYQSQPEDGYKAMAIAGKSLRGSKKQGAPAARLLSALGHRLGLTLLQVAVADKTNEITAVQELLQELVLKDKVVTVDALLTQREVAQTILDQGGDYVMVVKGNQPGLLAQVEGAIAGVDFYTQAPQMALTIEGEHGRIEQRQIITTSVLADCDLWPGLDQAFKIERQIVEQKSGNVRNEAVYGISSLSRERATAGVVLAINRGHWSIDNKRHWVRDVTYDEARSQVRKGSIPQVLAALRNTAISLLRWSGESNIAAAGRRFAAQPWAALALIGIHITP
jgi:predicted transposase YbfD/YdcC